MKKSDFDNLGTALDQLRSRLGTPVAEVRVAAAFLVLLLAHTTDAAPLPQWVDGVLLGYIALSLILVPILQNRPYQKRFRILPEILDIVAISLLIAATGGLGSGWFLLYLFPVMSTARFMGGAGVLGLVVLTGVSYAFATSILVIGTVKTSLLSFALRILALGGVSLTAANLVRTRGRGEAELVGAFEKVDRLILADGATDRVMGLILETALKLTHTDVCAMILVERERVAATFAKATVPLGTAPRPLDEEKAVAARIVQECFHYHLTTGKPLALPPGGLRSRGVAGPKPQPRGQQLQGRCVPLRIQGTLIGVLGAFTRRGFHYFTANDLWKLASLAPLVAIAQKNATLFHESRKRLELAYQIGGLLKTEYGLDDVFQSVVDLVSEELCSEEAALFLANEKSDRLEKKAVSGHDAETQRRLLAIEQSYDLDNNSLTLNVFKCKRPDLQNDIKPDEAYADGYSRHLPSTLARHYLGVPLLIGDEVLGVIRVVNKKAVDYQPRPGSANLAAEGFREDDLQLLAFIATQVAAAIRNAKFLEQKRYFENLVYTSPDPTLVVSDEGYIRNFNRACEEIWKREEKDVVGHSVAEFYPSVEHARNIKHRLQNSPEKALHDFSTEIMGADGEVIPIRLSTALLADRKGAVLGSIGIFRDQRPILRLEEERIRNEKLAALGRLAQMASHDIKHDFAAILVNLDPLERKLRGDVSGINAVRSIRTAATEALDKIQRMLLAARPKTPDPKVVRINEELHEFHAGSQQRAVATRVEFTLNVPAVDVVVSADVELLRQVFSNLFANSLDAIRSARHSKPGRQARVIEVTLEDTPGGALITWRDDGCGMSAEVLSRAFTAFYTTKDTGSGLGLSVTKTIIDNHGGEISIESEEGVGTTTRITLPNLAARAEAPAAESLAEPEGDRA